MPGRAEICWGVKRWTWRRRKIWRSRGFSEWRQRWMAVRSQGSGGDAGTGGRRWSSRGSPGRRRSESSQVRTELAVMTRRYAQSEAAFSPRKLRRGLKLAAQRERKTSWTRSSRVSAVWRLARLRRRPAEEAIMGWARRRKSSQGAVWGLRRQIWRTAKMSGASGLRSL